MKLFVLTLVFALSLLHSSLAHAKGTPVPLETFTVCPVTGNTPPARFDAPGCREVPVSAVDPQGKDIWVSARITLTSSQIAPPAGLFVSAKASSLAYANGIRLGANGMPGPSREREIPGRMDAVFFIPDHVLREGENHIVVRLSGFHSAVHLSRPVHWIAIAPYGNPVEQILRAYWPSLVTFGVLAAGALFFAASALSKVNRLYALLYALLSLLAAGQLFVEVSRGIFAYPYPVHDWRLIAIAGFSEAFGLALTAVIVAKFVERFAIAVFGGICLLTLIPLLLTSGFDGKAAYAMLVAATGCACVAGYAVMRGDRSAVIPLVALLAFAGSVIVFQGAFLDILFYFEVAAALLSVFAIRAITFEKERLTYEQERLRAHDLELALSRAVPAETARIRVNGAGALNVIDATHIALCKGADDYVELHLGDGRMILHNVALSDLETELPGYFLRVHRSFIVNTTCVQKLTREASGTGTLTLSNGMQAPVSRRIMPKVRTALT